MELVEPENRQDKNVERLKVGLLVNSLRASPENVALAKWLSNETIFETSLILLSVESNGEKRRWRRVRTLSLNGLRPVIFKRAVSLHEKLHRLKNRTHHTSTTKNEGPATEYHPLDGTVPLAHEFYPLVSRSGFLQSLNEDDLNALRHSRYGVLIRLNNGILRGGILTASKHGVLSFHHGDNRVNRGGPWGFWEIYERNPTTGFVLQRLTKELDGGVVLLRRNYMTRRTVTENRENLVLRSYPLLQQVLLDLATRGELPEAESPFPYAGKIYRNPTIAQSISFALPNPLKIAKSIPAKLSRSPKSSWRVGIVNQDWSSVSFRSHAVVPTHPKTWVADPFVVHRNGATGIFLEEFDRTARKGRISYSSIDERGRPSLPVPVLSEDFHLSFPSTFEYEGELYMTPESFDANQIRMYRCVDYPLTWKLHRVLRPNVAAVDPMVVEHQGLWYLFVNIDPIDNGDPNSELHIWWTSDPANGEWVEVAGTPNVVDPRKARNGGLLRSDEGLFRVGQRQGFGVYGESCSVFEVTSLSPHGYSETERFPLKANWQPRLWGPHHITSAAGYTAFDYVAANRRQRRH